MIRIDKWLWYARIVKSRSLAQKLVKGGKVRINKVKTANASASVKIGDVLTITLERQVLVYKVLAPGERRGPYPEARLLYEDLSPPPERDKLPPSQGDSTRTPKPNKHQRKLLRELKHSGNSEL